MSPITSFWRPCLGACVWLFCLMWWRPSPFELEWAISLLLFSPLVLIPLGLRVAQNRSSTLSESQFRGLSWRSLELLQTPAALSLVLSFFFPQESLGAILLAVPWLMMTALISLFGLLRIYKRGFASIAELGMDTGLVFLCVGGGWTVLNRAGIRPLDFEAVIVLLTAIHFHYAGFALPLLTGLAGHRHPGKLPNLAILGSIAGVPLVATGITTSQLKWGNEVECFAACFLALAGLLTALLYFQLFRNSAYSGKVRFLWLIASISLAVSMILAILYGCRFYVPLAWLDIPWMRALHGSANALGFAFAGILGWTLVPQKTLS